MSEERLRRRWERERRARKEAECLIEQKSRELYDANSRLENLVEELEDRVHERTVELERTAERYRHEAGQREKMERYKGTLYNAITCIESADSIEGVSQTLMAALGRGLKWRFAAYWTPAEGHGQLRSTETWWDSDHEGGEAFARQTKMAAFRMGEGLPGRVWESGSPAWIEDVVVDDNFPRAPFARKAGLHGAFAFPIRQRGQVVAVIEIFSDEILDPDEHLLELTGALGLQIGQFLERVEADDRFRNAHQLLEVIHTMQTHFMRTGDIRGAFDAFLESILNLTGCEYGFMGEILRTAEGSPYLKTYAITNIAWNDDTRTFYEKNAPAGLEFFNLKTLFGATMVSEEIVIANDPAKDARAGGIPEGHPPLESFIGIPLKSGDHMIGMIGLANRKGGFDSAFLDEIASILSAASQVIESQRLEARRAASELELRESREMFSMLLQGAPEAIVVSDSHGLITMVNEQALSLLDYSEEQVIGQPIEMLVPAERQNEHGRQSKTYLENPMTRPMSVGRELAARRRDGSIIPVEIGLNSVSTSQGPLVIAVINDLSEQIAIREKILKNLEEERRIGALKSRFVSMASHEFKTPLAMILSASSFLELGEGKIKAEQRLSKLGQIRAAVARMNGLLDNILTFGRRQDTPILNPVPHDLVDVIHAIFAEHNLGRGGSYCLDLHTQSAECPIFADESILSQIFSNLIGNAVKYSSEGSTLRVAIRDVGKCYEVEIRDQGIGIEEGEVSLLFSPFQRGKNVENIPGSGLGLAIVSRALEYHGGTVQYVQQESPGTTFVVTLKKEQEVADG